MGKMYKVKLGSLGTFARGISKHRPRNDKKLYEGGGIPLIQTGDVTNSNLYVESHTQEYNQIGLNQSKLWDKGTLVITIAANIAETAILKYPMAFPDSVVGFTADTSKTSNIFMHYLLTNFKKNIQSNVKSTGSIQDNINLNFLNNLELEVPEIEVQHKISKVLFLLDSKIELNRKINEELEKMAQDIFAYWFLQFDFPDENGNPYKSSGGKMVYIDQLKQEIPDSWKVKKLKEIVEIGSGFAFKSSDYKKDGKYRIVTIKNVQNNKLDLANVERINFIPKAANDFVKLKIGDVLISLTGNVGRIAVVDSENLLLNQRVGKLLVKDPNTIEFVKLFLSSAEQQARLKRIAGGSSQANLSPIQAVDVICKVPTDELLIKFKKIVEPIFKKIQMNNQESQKLEKQRDYLLPMLMNGQVNVDNIKIN